MAPLSAPDNRVFLGVGGSGKSTLARHQSYGPWPRVIVCDPNAEEAHAAGAIVVSEQGELPAILATGEPVRICWRGFDAMGEERGLDWVCRAAWAAGDCLIVWDEMDFFYPFVTHTSWAYKLWNAGRHQRCRVFAIARSALAIPRTLTRNMTRAMVFHTQEPSDLQLLAGTRSKPGLIGPEAAAAVAGLQPYHAVDWQRGGAWTVKRAPFD